MRLSSSVKVMPIFLLFCYSLQSQNKSQLSNSVNNFSFDLYKKIIEQDSSNVFFSPIGLSTAFAQVYIGSDKKTKNEIANVFGFNNSLVEFPNEFLDFSNQVFSPEAKSTIELLNANSIWVNNKFELKPEFVKSLEDNFNSKVFALDVSKPSECADQVNAWVKNSTLDKINNMISKKDIEPETVFLLLNSLYFKDKWLNTFDEKNTREDMFSVSASEKVKIQMMNTAGFFSYAQHQNYDALQIPYSTKNYSMLILLPKDISGIFNLEKTLDSINVENILNELKKNEVCLALPKFKFEYEIQNLKSLLQQLGVLQAFDESGAEFSGLINSPSNKNIFLSDVLQKTFVEVNEEGTEAAATTLIKVNSFTRGSHPDPIYFRADHPFLFFIIENNTKCILFMGRCLNPAK